MLGTAGREVCATDGGNSSKPQSHTRLGAGLRIEGNVTFIGGLRIKGDVVSETSAVGDSNKTIIVSKSGKITGAVRSQHLILSGQISDSVHCARTVDILKHGRVDGDGSASRRIPRRTT